MTTRNVGTGFSPNFGPVWAPEDGGTGGADGAAGNAGDPNAGGTGAETGGQGAPGFDPEKTFAALDKDTRGWLQKQGLETDPVKLATKAHEQEKVLGSAIRIPKDDAPEEERAAFLDKLGRPKTADDYKFEAPKNMPESLPYDETLDKQFRGIAHNLGLSQKQAAGLRDMFVDYQVNAFNGITAQSTQALEAKATKATETMTAKWGPIDGATAKQNFEVANRVFTQAPGGQEVLAELKELGLVGPNKEILSAPLAFMLSSIGNALYVEDGVLRGNPGMDTNPWDEKTFNLTAQSKIWREDPDAARGMIAAIGKKPSDFGLPG